MKVLAEFSVTNQTGNERQVSEQIARVVQESINLPTSRIECLKTAVGEAVMNAMEHGNQYQADLPVVVLVRASSDRISVSIQDQGGQPGDQIPEAPDLAAKVDGLQSPRGWGLFLIQKMVDEVKISSDGAYHTIELIMHLEGEDNGR